MGNLLTAEEARKKTKESTFIIDRIAKEIEEQARRSCTQLVWSTYEEDKDVLAEVKGKLMNVGYKVQEDSENSDCWIIAW